MDEDEKKVIIRNLFNFYMLFQKEILDMFSNDNSILSPVLVSALREIYFHADITPSILSKRLAITVPNTSRCLQQLSDLNYIVRIKDEKDKRITHIKLTEQGADLVENSIRIMDELTLKKLSVLEVNELVKLSEAFSTIIQLFDKIGTLNNKT